METQILFRRFIMKKQKWTEKPVTWGGYMKLCAVVYVISMMVYAPMYIQLYEPAWWTKLKESVKDCFEKMANKK